MVQLLALILAFHQRLSPSIILSALLGWCLGQMTWLEKPPDSQRTTWRLTVDQSTVATVQPVVLKDSYGRYVWRYGKRRWCAGTTVELAARLAPAIAQSNPGHLAPFRHQFSRHIVGQLRSVRGLKVVALPNAMQRLGCHARQGVYDHLQSVLTNRNHVLAAALLLGERTPKLRTTQRDLNGLGLAHLLAVSGLHIGLGVSLLLCLFCIPCLITPNCRFTGWRMRSVVLVSALLMSWWCAWPVGGVRICVWALVACVAPHRPLSVTGWLSLGVLIAIEPRWSADLGFLLSHSVSLALVHAVHRWKSVFTVPVVATLASLPSLSLVGLPCALVGIGANLVFVPFFSLVLMITTLSLALGNPILADHMLSLFTMIVGTINTSLGSAAVPLHWSISTALGFSLACLAGLNKRWTSAWLCAATATLSPPSEPGTQVWMLPVGHGDMALVRTARTQVVIDTGPSPHTIAHTLLPRLKPHLDALIVSHADHDHIGGAHALCSLQPPKHFWSQTEVPGCPPAKNPKTLRFADLTITRLETADDWVRGRNERSLAVAVRVPGHRLLYLGDIGIDREQDLGDQLGKATIIKVPHHGSRTSSSPELIEEISAQIALIGAGPNDRFGHPHPEIVARWSDSGAKVEIADQTDRCWVLHPRLRPKRCAALAYGRQSPARRGQNLR